MDKVQLFHEPLNQQHTYKAIYHRNTFSPY